MISSRGSKFKKKSKRTKWKGKSEAAALCCYVVRGEKKNVMTTTMMVKWAEHLRNVTYTTRDCGEIFWDPVDLPFALIGLSNGYGLMNIQLEILIGAATGYKCSIKHDIWMLVD